MAEETITFELIRRIQREEQRLPKLTRLPENFYQSVNSYMQQKRKMEQKEDRKGALEVKSIERLIEDIFNRRERKILNQALITVRTKIPPENLTDEEKQFFEQLISSINTRRTGMLDMLLEEEAKRENGMIVFKEDVQEFVGVDMKTYGPFKKGDVASLPEENAKILMEKGLIEDFKASK